MTTLCSRFLRGIHDVISVGIEKLRKAAEKEEEDSTRKLREGTVLIKKKENRDRETENRNGKEREEEREMLERKRKRKMRKRREMKKESRRENNREDEVEK
uniref:Uncharacterized protein n=1 Tax=Octopus bimaculoides TaxID=37653 RepID=A0A0L8GJ53_OCTBM